MSLMIWGAAGLGFVVAALAVGSYAFPSVKERIFFWKDFWPAQAIIYRNRGDTYAPEFQGAVRMVYDEKPDGYMLKSGEEIPAVSLNFVQNSTEGVPTFHLVEGEKGHLIPVKPTNFKIDVEDVFGDSEEVRELEAEDLQDIGIEELESLELAEDMDLKEDDEGKLMLLDDDGKPTDLGERVMQKAREKIQSDKPLEAERFLDSKGRNMIEYAVLDNKDDRLTFWMEHYKAAAEKYSLPHWITENRDLIFTALVGMVVILAVMFTTDALAGVSQQMGSFTDRVGDLAGAVQQASGTTTPPGK